MAVIEVRDLGKSYAETRALDQINLQFAEGEFFGLLGPSGSGKTTLLRAIAGFVTPDKGEILFDGERVDHLAPHQRNIGMVFQNYALFPHMNVAENIAFGLTVKSRRPNKDIQRQVDSALELVRLSGLGSRKPAALSGGQQQRVALARALITRPKVLLLDEPLGALDRRLRQEMQVELKAIQRQTGITAIFVTHDQEEALSLSDRIGIIHNGKLIENGTPLDIYHQPKSLFAAQFLGDANIFANGQQIIRPEKILLAPTGTMAARIKQVIFSGPSVSYILQCSAFQNNQALVFAQNGAAKTHQAGEDIYISWDDAHVITVMP